MRRDNLRLICVIFIAAFLCTSLTGCFDRKEVDDLAYVIGFGLEKGKTNFLKMTLQIAVPLGVGGGGGGGNGDGGGGKPVTVTTIETPTIYSGLNMANNYISKEINLSHTKVIAFSEELAREGLEIYINAIKRYREFRGNTYIVVVKGSVEEYLRNVKPVLEVNPAKYYEMNYSAYRYTGLTPGSQFLDFYLQHASTSSQPVATLAAISRYKTSDEFTLEGSTYREKRRNLPLQGDFKAGEIPKVGELKSEIMGLAVFDGDKMVGELDGEETTNYLMTKGNIKSFYSTIPDPLNDKRFVLLNLRQSRKPVLKVRMLDNKPVIGLKIRLEGDFLSIQSGSNYEDLNKLPILEESAEVFLKEGMQRFLYKTSKELNADICGFGSYMKSKFADWDRWENFNWLSRYKDAQFNVSIDLKVRRPGLIIRSSPVYTTEGKVIPR